MAALKKRLVVAAVTLVCGASLVRLSCANPTGLTPQTNEGRPARIISLVPSLTEMLYAVGAGSQVVGVSSYDEFPPQVKTLPRVGALFDPDLERILALRPDLVLTYGSQTTLEMQLARTGIEVFSYRHAGVAGIMRTLRDLGAATGHAADGDRKAREVQAQLEAISAKVSPYPRIRTLLVFGRQPQALQQMYVSGGVGFMDDVLRIAGGANVFADVKRESTQPSQEIVLTRKPDAIVEVRSSNPLSPQQLVAERRAWAPLSSMPAVRNGRIYFLSADYLLVPGPRVALAAEAIARVLHPDAFR